MRVIRTLSDLDSTLDLAVDRVVRERLDMLAEYDEELARFIIPEPGDSMAAVEKEIGFPFADPSWEWMIDHGGLFEAPFIMSDDGYAHVLLVTDSDGIDPELIALCRTNAEPAGDTDTALI